jgi:putative ABC transport system permease protein
VDTLFKDIQYAIRSLAKRPAFALTAVLTLALGIGANTAIFSVVNGVLLRPLPYADSHQLVALRESNALKQPDSQVAPGNFLDWQQQNSVFSQLETYRTVSYNLTGDGNPERILSARISAGMFRMLGATPILGRDFVEEDDRPGNDKVVMIGEGLWQRRFGGDTTIIGKTLKLNGENFVVVGVVPTTVRLPDQRERELWTPIAFKDTERSLRNARFVEAIGRLKPEVSFTQANAELTAIAGRLAQQYPETNSGWSVRVAPLLDFVVGDSKKTLWVLFIAVALVLLIACANVTNLLLARAVTRRREIAIRTALGAGWPRITRQLVTESLVLSAVGGLLAWPLAHWVIKALLAWAPTDLPRIATVSVDGRTLLFTLGITLLTSLLFGVVPALQMSKVDPNKTLKESGDEGNQGVRQGRLGDLLIAGEVGLALVLLIGSGLLLRTVWGLQRVDPGFDYHNSLAVTVQLSDKHYSDDLKINAFATQLLEQSSTIPGVESAGLARILPIIHDLPVGVYVEGRPREPDSQLPQANYSSVSPDYFEAMRVPLIAGRAFDARDSLNANRVAIVSETFAKRFFPTESPIGKRINVVTGPEAFREIVGVVGDVKQNGIARELRPHAYEPFAQAPNTFMTLVVRTNLSDPTQLVSSIRSKVLEIDRELPLQSVRTLESMLTNSIKQQRFTSAVLAVFAGVALVMAIAGLYGVISYSVGQRTRELGVRLALGAEKGDVLRLVLKRAMWFVVLGEMFGIVAALLLTRLLSGLLFGVTPTDVWTFLVVTVALTIVALVACYIPARRATRVDPLSALRCQ